MPNRYNIQMASRLTGIGIHTLRAWESRYQAVVPERSERGQRLYHQSDVEKLQLLSQLSLLGRAISTMAHLTIDELKNELALCGVDVTINQEKFFPAEKADTNKALDNLLLALRIYKLDVLNHEIQKLKISLSERICL